MNVKKIVRKVEAIAVKDARKAKVKDAAKKEARVLKIVNLKDKVQAVAIHVEKIVQVNHDPAMVAKKAVAEKVTTVKKANLS